MSKVKKGIGDLKEGRYYIDGMHCASCEVLIEKKFLKQEGIEFADASLSNGVIEFKYRGEKPTTSDLTEMFKENGYTFSDRKYINEKDIPLFKIVNGQLRINPTKAKNVLNIIFITILVLIGLNFIQKSGIGSKVVLSSTSSYFSFFAFGVVAGLSSCAALVGGLLLSMSKQWSEIYIDSESKTEQLKPFTMFNVGRLASFTLLGGLLGAVGSLLGISLNRAPVGTAIVIMAVSILMTVLGLQMLDVQWAHKFKIALPKFFTRSVATEENFKGRYMPLLVGGLTFFLPCGLTLIAQSYALASGSFIRGALMMLSFSLGTLPILGAISFASINITQKPKINALFSKVAGILVVMFAIYNFNAQLDLLGLKSLSDVKLPSISQQKTPSQNTNNGFQINVKTDENGVQVVKMVAKGFSYKFTNGSIIKADTPTKLIVDNQGVDGCAVTLSARGLLSSYVYLKNGENVIDLGKPAKGTYKFTCSMGMVSPITLKAI